MTLRCPDFAKARLRPSPNFGPRVGCDRPSLLILHYTGMESEDGAETWLCSEASQVSSHYLVHLDGSVVQMVAEADRAWHAGKSYWAGETDINSHSVGIEVVNVGHPHGYPDFGASQIASVIELCRDICARHDIQKRCVLAHSDIAPGRKIDPGEKFPWQLLAEAGVGHWVEPEAPGAFHPLTMADMDELLRLLANYGYGIDAVIAGGRDVSSVVEAFQRHFRPVRVDGVADPGTIATLRRLSLEEWR